MTDSDTEDMDTDLPLGLEPGRRYPVKDIIINRWREKYAEGELTRNDFKYHWKSYVPQLVSVDDMNKKYRLSMCDEELSVFLLFTPMEEFVFEGSMESVLEHLQKSAAPSSVCGHVFKMSDPTYNCRDCCTDLTCVLCADCFKNSEHRLHTYKMSTSSGGGCCDCGDVEAWRSHPHCSLHIAGVHTAKPAEVMPKEMKNRARIVFGAIVRYAHQLFTLEGTPDLPVDLKLEMPASKRSHSSINDQYCTVLYNDETHTFEHVISTLTKVLKCNHKDAAQFVTDIDRVGRAIVKCGDFQTCLSVKEGIDSYTSRNNAVRPLRVVLCHAHVVIHQYFALKLLAWLQKALYSSKELREVFCSVMHEKDENMTSVVEGVMLHDSRLWKTARIQWHRLFIVGMMIEYENKVAFAKVFTKHYGRIMKDFSVDDHDHNVSVACMSVQLYTVPSIAHTLIEQDDVLFILFNTLLSECNPNIKDNTLTFQRADHMVALKRSQYILYDLHYLLTIPCTSWNENLRKGFLQGFYLFLKLLALMQEMDSVIRQVGQHMEYEPEWETGFNMFIRLMPVITAMIEWCSTDKGLLIKAFRSALMKLRDKPVEGLDRYESRELIGHKVHCIPYDVTTQRVSIHLPLTRLCAGMYLKLQKYDLSYDSPELQVANKPLVMQLIEPILRAQVMIAQVHAGLWRRNGYSVLHQIFFYSNNKCRPEMLDEDIVMLQIGASLIDSDEFVLHILNKYKLLMWVNYENNEDFFKKAEEESVRVVVHLIEEFLSLMIAVVGERYMLGVGNVTEEDCMKKEIIQRLCIKPLPHSELMKELPEYSKSESDIEKIINEVAEFKMPASSSGTGTYDLRLPSYSQYNVFYYHYSKEELSKSEENERRRRKTAGMSECIPPPPLPEFMPSLKKVVGILQCDLMIHVMKAVLHKTIDTRNRGWSEGMLQRVLHLMGYALYEEESDRYEGFSFTSAAEKSGLLALLEQVVNSTRGESHKDFVKWVLNKFRQVKRRGQEEMDVDEETDLEAKDDDKQSKAKLAAERRAKLMAHMAAMQKSFMKDNKNLLEDTEAAKKCDESMVWETSEPQQIVAVGKDKTSVNITPDILFCILCQEKQEIKLQNEAVVYLSFAQKSTVLCRCKPGEEPKPLPGNLCLDSMFSLSPFASTCGHVMHASCWKKYYINAQSKENRRPFRIRQPNIGDMDRREYPCPLCESLCNTVIPVLPLLSSFSHDTSVKCDVEYETWLKSLYVIGGRTEANEKITNAKPSKIPKHDEGVLSEDGKANEQSGEPSAFSQNVDAQVQEIVVDGQDIVQIREPDVEVQIQLLDHDKEEARLERNPELTVSRCITEMVNSFLKANQFVIITDGQEKDSITMLWKCCAYVVHMTERCLRLDEDKPLIRELPMRLNGSVEGLVRLSSMIGLFGCHIRMNHLALDLLKLMFDHSASDVLVTDWDAFTMLVSMTAAIPSLYTSYRTGIPIGSLLDSYILRLCTTAAVANIIAACEFNLNDAPAESSENTECLKKFWSLLHGTEDLNTSSLWEQVKLQLKPFLRCCVIFYHYVTGVPGSRELRMVGGDTYENMCSYLGLPILCEELLGDESTLQLFKLWYNSYAVSRFPKITEYLPLKTLVNLPRDYSDLINSVADFTCPRSSEELDDSRNPTMCLICGEVLCSQSYCCQETLPDGESVGACTFHTRKCGLTAGIYLRIRDCEVLLMSTTIKGCFIPAPYVDRFGETDQGLRRGNPLKLCDERYKKLNIMWLTHRIQDEIMQRVENSSTGINTTFNQWNHL